MMATVRPANLALEDQILAMLREHAPLPQSTAAIAAKIGHGTAFEIHAVVYPRLDRLARRGLIERYRVGGYRSVYWTTA